MAKIKVEKVWERGIVAEFDTPQGKVKFRLPVGKIENGTTRAVTDAEAASKFDVTFSPKGSDGFSQVTTTPAVLLAIYDAIDSNEALAGALTDWRDKLAKVGPVKTSTTAPTVATLPAWAK